MTTPLRQFPPKAIVGVVCEQLCVPYTNLLSTSRHPRVTLARTVIVHICRKRTYLSYPDINALIRPPRRDGKRRCHTTALTAYKRTPEWMPLPAELDMGVGTYGDLIDRIIAVLDRMFPPIVGMRDEWDNERDAVEIARVRRAAG